MTGGGSHIEHSPSRGGGGGGRVRGVARGGGGGGGGGQGEPCVQGRSAPFLVPCTGMIYLLWNHIKTFRAFVYLRGGPSYFAQLYFKTVLMSYQGRKMNIDLYVF